MTLPQSFSSKIFSTILFQIILITPSCTTRWGLRSVIDVCACQNDLIRKYETELDASNYFYKTCLVEHIKHIITPAIFISANTLFTYGCHERVTEVCCRGPNGYADKCERFVGQQQDGTQCYLSLNKKRKVMNLIWDQDILSAKECAAFGTNHGGIVANVMADTRGYRVVCGCGKQQQNCEAGDMLACDNYVAGMIILKGNVSKVALFRSKFLNTSSDTLTFDKNISDTTNEIQIEFVSGCYNLKVMNYNAHVIIASVLLAVHMFK